MSRDANFSPSPWRWLAGAAALAWACAAPAQALPALGDPPGLARAALGPELGLATVAEWRAGAVRQASVYRAEAGAAVWPWAEPAPPMYEIGSVSKVFTGLLLAQAVERGELALDDTLGQRLAGRADGLPPAVAAISLRQLVTHTSCLPRQVSPDLRRVESEIRQMTRAGLWAGLAAVTLSGSAPCRAAYSNFGFAVLGELLAVHFGQPWEALVHERITGPLGMKDTLLALGEREGRLAAAFNGEQEAPYWPMQAYAGAGGLRSTADDMLLFARAVGAGRSGPLGAAAERLVTPLARYEGHSIGYAVWLRGPEDRRVVWHDGLTGGYRALWSVLPRGEALVGFVSNSQAPLQSVGQAIDRGMFPVADTPVPVDAAALAAFQGVYRFETEGVVGFVAQEGVLHVRGPGQGFTPLVPVAPGVFTHPGRAARFEFSQGDAASATVVLAQGGRTLTARRDAAASAAARYRVPGADRLAALRGRYRMPWGAVMEITEVDRQLMARLPRQPRFPVFALTGGEERFAFDAVKAEMTFERDAQGAVTALTLFQNGVHRALRVSD